MTRPLPSRPNVTQLKHQAKDLLRAQRNGEASACGVLRRLRRFEGADDGNVLAADVALHEAQYALAMEYGFPSWNALAEHIADSVPTKVRDVCRTDGGTVIGGIEKVRWGGKGVRENSALAALGAALNVIGDPISYEELMGFSGAAFRLQVAQPQWCPSAPCAPCGFDCLEHILTVLGCRFERVWMHDRDPAIIEKTRPAVIASLDAGRPVLAMSEESALIVGYRGDGTFLVRPFAPRQEGYVPMERWPWETLIITPPDGPGERRAMAITSLRTAVALATTPAFEGYAAGFAAYAIWAEQLEDDARFEGLDGDNWWGVAHANGYMYGSLYDCRLAAEKYLRIIVDDLPEIARPHAIAAANAYEQIHRTQGRERPGLACAWSLMPWHLKSLANWTPDVRATQATVLREMAGTEREAIGHIQAALAAV